MFDTIHEIATRIAACEHEWRLEAHALEHGHTSCLRGPNHALPHHVARHFADQLKALLVAVDEITGPK